MRRYSVRFHPDASRDIDEVYVWIAREASPSIASGYIKRIRTFCNQLRNFPHRETVQEDILPSLRFIGFEGRASIAFHVVDRTVVVLRVLYAGRQFDSR